MEPAFQLTEGHSLYSREDKFFRIDLSELKSDGRNKGTAAARERFILRPDGYVLLAAKTDKDYLVLVDWGTVEEGIVLLFNYEWIQRSARAGRLPADLILEELISEASSLPELYKRMVVTSDIQSKQSLTADLPWTSKSAENLMEIELSPDDGTLNLVWNSESVPEGSWSSKSTLICQHEKGVVNKYECITNHKNSGRMLLSEICKYDFELFGTFPMFFRQHINNKNAPENSYTSTINWETKSIDWTPVPLGVFSFETQGLNSLRPESVWSRRLNVLLVALALLSVVFLVKWYQRRVET
ncbi:MAG: hypothetical protein SH868_19295 [Bythopirellula sp.]|nr:hypothetical protein [Bythopirellula sp.]